jgi:CheY-like chemotaxis protein
MRILFFPALLCFNEVVKFGKRGGIIKILVVEDNSDTRDLLALRAQITGYLPVLANDGKAGVEKSNEDKPDLILMEMMMPAMDSWEAARALRAYREAKDIPILATTALGSSEDLKSCLDAACNGYIIKPFNGVDLQRKIRDLLATKRITGITEINIMPNTY